MSELLPGTIERIPMHTKPEVNDRIFDRTIGNVARYGSAPAEERAEHLLQLDREWDVERVIAATDGSMLLAAGVLGLALRRRWLFVIPAVIGAFLLQHALVGWCALMPILRRRGVRTQYEIAGEKAALLR